MITKLISILILCRSKDEAIDNYIRAILESLRDQMPEVRTLHFSIYKKLWFWLYAILEMLQFFVVAQRYTYTVTKIIKISA